MIGSPARRYSMTPPTSVLRPLFVGALALGLAVVPLRIGGIGDLGLSMAWAGNGNGNGNGKGDSTGNGNANGSANGNGNATGNTGGDTAGNSSSTTGPVDATTAVKHDEAGSGIGDSHDERNPSVIIIANYKKAALSAANADEAVAVAKGRLDATQSRMSAAEQTVQAERTTLDVAMKARDQSAIASAQAAYDLALVERSAAQAALATARRDLSAAEVHAREAHEGVDRTLDAAANKDITDKLAESVNAFLGLGGSL